MKKVCVLLAEGFEELEALSVVDLLRRAEMMVDLVSISNEVITVGGARRITVIADKLFDAANYTDYDMLVLPGGQPGTDNLKANPSVVRVVQYFNKENKYVAAICAAPTVLHKAGVLEDKSFTCYPSVAKEITGAIYSNEKVVVDGNVITSQGVGTALEFARKLIEVLLGAETAVRIAGEVLM
jgi:4-methyl-5(b-hydroxyethyl)-thiazole monophosphate biosynthesis